MEIWSTHLSFLELIKENLFDQKEKEGKNLISLTPNIHVYFLFSICELFSILLSMVG